jgi:hypothetical protein
MTFHPLLPLIIGRGNNKWGVGKMNKEEEGKDDHKG